MIFWRSERSRGAKYAELLMDVGACTRDAMVKRMVSEGSTIINEGKVLLVDEFGKDYGTYFSILSLIAAGNNTRSEIENAIGTDIGGYLTKLEGECRLVTKGLPVCETRSNRNVHYTLKDNFLRFWFRFVWKFQSLIKLKRPKPFTGQQAAIQAIRPTTWRSRCRRCDDAQPCCRCDGRRIN